jgi:hypothetical protein
LCLIDDVLDEFPDRLELPRSHSPGFDARQRVAGVSNVRSQRSAQWAVDQASETERLLDAGTRGHRAQQRAH